MCGTTQFDRDSIKVQLLLVLDFAERKGHASAARRKGSHEFARSDRALDRKEDADKSPVTIKLVW